MVWSGMLVTPRRRPARLVLWQTLIPPAMGSRDLIASRPRLAKQFDRIAERCRDYLFTPSREIQMNQEFVQSKPSLDFVVDGSNVLLSNRIGGVPSVRAFAALLSMLDSEGKSFKVWFDNSIFHRVRENRGDVDELQRLIDELRKHDLLGMAPRADDGIQMDCHKAGAPVINGSDKNDSWRAPVPPIFRCRLNLERGRDVMVYVSPAGNGKKLFSVSLSRAFQFRGISCPAIADTGTAPNIGAAWTQPPKFKGRSSPGSLLVLALDASPSMDTTDTFDGRSRAAHVNDIVRDTLAGLSQSKIGPGLLVCLLSFSGDVVCLSPGDSGYVFSPVQAWLNTPLRSYLSTVDRDWTNIRLALDRAADAIDGFRQSGLAQQMSMNWQNATVVVLTDGEHLTQVNGKAERSQDIVNHVFATLNRSDNVSFGFIGLGNKADHDALVGWASQATPEQLAIAASKRVQLEQQRLYVKANSQDTRMGQIVRSFVDLASSRVR